MDRALTTRTIEAAGARTAWASSSTRSPSSPSMWRPWWSSTTTMRKSPSGWASRPISACRRWACDADFHRGLGGAGRWRPWPTERRRDRAAALCLAEPGSAARWRRRGGQRGHLIHYHNLLIGLHIVAVIAWMAGLLYLPRLFAYHTRAAAGSEMDETFKVMEHKLLTNHHQSRRASPCCSGRGIDLVRCCSGWAPHSGSGPGCREDRRRGRPVRLAWLSGASAQGLRGEPQHAGPSGSGG